MKKIAFFELEPWEERYVEEKLKGYKLKFIDHRLNIRNVSKAKDCDAIGIFIYSEVDEDILDKLPKLKLVATMSTGFDHVDVEECKNRKIIVSNVPFYGENTVAEHTFALILNISRKIFESVEQTRKGNFSLDHLRGFDLKGKTLGIIGGGHIGMHVARMAQGFEMKVLVHDLHHDKKLAKKLSFRYAKDLDEVLSRADILSLHVPYNKHTHHMINMDNIKKIKKGAILINTARGGIIETKALLKAIDKKIISYAGLDVLEGECDIKEEKQLLSKHFKLSCEPETLLQDHVLLFQDNVFITPHNAFNSEEALKRILDTTIRNIKSYFSKSPHNVVRRWGVR